MPSTDPVAVFDDFILGHILSFLPADDVVLSGYNVSKAWRGFYHRSRACRGIYLALPDIDTVEQIELAHTEAPGAVDWRALCLDSVRLRSAWERGNCTPKVTSEVARSKRPAHQPPFPQAIDRSEGTLLCTLDLRVYSGDESVDMRDLDGLDIWRTVPLDPNGTFEIQTVNILGPVLFSYVIGGDGMVTGDLEVWVTLRAAKLFNMQPDPSKTAVKSESFQYLTTFRAKKTAEHSPQEGFGLRTEYDHEKGVWNLVAASWWNKDKIIVQRIASSAPRELGQDPAEGMEVITTIPLKPCDEDDYVSLTILDSGYVFRVSGLLDVYSCQTGEDAIRSAERHQVLPRATGGLIISQPVFTFRRPILAYDWRSTLRQAATVVGDNDDSSSGQFTPTRVPAHGLRRDAATKKNKAAYEVLAARLDKPHKCPHTGESMEMLLINRVHISGRDLVVVFTEPIFAVVKDYVSVFRRVEGLPAEEQQRIMADNAIVVGFGGKGDAKASVEGPMGTKVAVVSYGDRSKAESVILFDTADMHLPPPNGPAKDIPAQQLFFTHRPSRMQLVPNGLITFACPTSVEEVRRRATLAKKRQSGPASTGDGEPRKIGKEYEHTIVLRKFSFGPGRG